MNSLADVLGRKSCFACGSEKLSIVFLISQEGVPSDQEGHSITYSHVMLSACADCRSGQVEALDHDCWDFEEVWDQYEWYILSADDFERLSKSLVSCPHPLSPSCSCPAHTALRSAASSLPRSSWEWALEHAAHVHRIGLEPKEGFRWFKALSVEDSDKGD